MPITDTRGYSEPYLAIRAKVDLLCADIMLGRISPAKAPEIYAGLENEFCKDDPQKAELFKMVYKSRIERLSSQFLAGTGR